MADNTLHSSARANWLERRFALRSRGGTLRTECLAGITGFLAAAYLLVVIPGLLAIGGMDKGAATTGTILVFVVGSLLMAFYANLPFIVGPGIGGSVLVGVTLAGSEGIGWQTGLGIACWSGILFFLLTRFGLREVVTRSVPQSIKLGLTASIGLFVAVLGFRNAGLVLANAKTNALMLGDFLAPGALVALCGLFLAIALQARKVPGAILWAILCATLVGIPFGVTKLPTHFIDAPHSLAPVLGQVDLLGALTSPSCRSCSSFSHLSFSPPWGRRWRWAARRVCWMKKATCRRLIARSWSIRLPPRSARGWAFRRLRR